MDIMKVGSHGSTFGGNPLAVVVSKAAIKYCLDFKLSENAEKLGYEKDDAILFKIGEIKKLKALIN